MPSCHASIICIVTVWSQHFSSLFLDNRSKQAGTILDMLSVKYCILLVNRGRRMSASSTICWVRWGVYKLLWPVFWHFIEKFYEKFYETRSFTTLFTAFHRLFQASPNFGFKSEICITISYSMCANFSVNRLASLRSIAPLKCIYGMLVGKSKD